MTPITSSEELDEVLSRPTERVLQALRRTAGDVMILGAGGKLGPTLARMVRRGFDLIGNRTAQVIAVSRFKTSKALETLEQTGIKTISCDLLNRDSVQRLPDVRDVLYLVGQKFGTSETPELTWATNCIVPSRVAERFHRSRLVVLSTGCVYPLVEVNGPGATEQMPLTPPGEYANSCVARERIFEYYSRQNQTPMTFVRLCYAIDLRYGVLLDLALNVFHRRPINVEMGSTHVIWQQDANARIIQALEHVSTPPAAVNVTGRDRLSIRALALELGRLLEREVTWTGHETSTAWLWNADRSYEWFGIPDVSIDEMLQATAEWVKAGRETLDRPTHFDVRDGNF